MYMELVGRLRNCATQAAPCKICDMIEDRSCSDTLMKQAADAIEELSNAGSAYGRGWTLGYDSGRAESKPRWIPVAERLPDVDEKVLTFARNKYDGSWFMDITSWTGVRNHDEYQFWGYGDSMKVTHWMPLSEPPKEETE